MKANPYTYDTKKAKGLKVDAATMFDINKTIMRCLVKNLAMFGLGLYIYAGEDLPESPSASKEQLEELKSLFEEASSLLKKSPKTFENQALAHFKYSGKFEDINESFYELLKEYTQNGIDQMKAAQENKEK